jgi:hypothetical protein
LRPIILAVGKGRDGSEVRRSLPRLSGLAGEGEVVSSILTGGVPSRTWLELGVTRSLFRDQYARARENGAGGLNGRHIQFGG